MGSVGPATGDVANHKQFICVVKGAGPSGLAAALSVHKALSDHAGSPNPSCSITVVEKRPFRPTGQGRRNMVAIRPEGLRRLHELGALTFLRDRGWITDLEKGATINEWDQQEGVEGSGIWEWPISRYEPSMKIAYPPRPGADDKDDVMENKDTKGIDQNVYQVPSKISEQIPCCYVDLGHLEDALLDVIATKPEMEVKWSASIELLSGKNDTYNVVLHERISNVDFNHKQNGNTNNPAEEKRTPLHSTPDLIILASGKNDHTLKHQLNFTKTIGLKLEDTNLPISTDPVTTNTTTATTTTATTASTTSHNPRGLISTGPPHEIESQMFSVFGVTTPSRQSGHITHTNRKHNTGVPLQRIVEIEMSHRDTTHLLLQIPRGFDTTSSAATAKLGAYVTRRVNAILNTSYGNVAQMKSEKALVWGDPLGVVPVETATATEFAFGRNVVLVGDAGVSCSPSSGVGADIGMTVDSASVQRLVTELMGAKRRDVAEEEGKASLSSSDSDSGSNSNSNSSTSTSSRSSPGPKVDAWQRALDGFSLRKAETAVMWSVLSRAFYVTGAEAEQIVKSVREHEASGGISVELQ